MSDEHGGIDDPGEAATVAALMADLAPTLADPATWDEPPPWLADSIVAAIATERATSTSTEHAATSLPRPARRSRRPRQTWWLAAAAAVVALAIVGVVATQAMATPGRR